MTTTYNPSNLGAWWESRQKADSKQWLRVSAEVGEWLRPLTGRDDLIAVVEPGSGKGAPAVFLPESGTIEVNPEVCAEGVDPAEIDMTNEVGFLKNPAFAGACRHEGGHGKHSKWPLDQNPKKRAVVQAALLLEESAMEGDIVRDTPHHRVLLRSAFHKIVNKSDDGLTTVAGAAQMAALVGGRVDAGVLDEAEVAPILDAVKAVLGERYEGFRQIWRDVHAIGIRDDAAVMEAHGKRWLDLLGDDAEPEQGEGTIIFVCGGEPGDGEEGDGSGSGGIVAQVADAISEAAGKEAEKQVDAAKARDIAEQRKKDAAEAKKDEQAAERVFISHGSGSGNESLSGKRAPTGTERGQANVLAEAIRQAQYRDRTVTVVSGTMPPGKLRSPQVVKQAAERSLGLAPTAQPWQRKVRRHVEQPPITVGIGCDISGSMRWATEAVASAAWVVAQAVHTTDGDSATVAYGDRVHAVVRPGEAPAMVQEFHANGGTEDWVGAMRSLNGALNMDNSAGVRLMVFISDGHYTGRQKEEGARVMQRLQQSGVKVLWIGFHGTGHSGWHTDQPPAGAEYVRVEDPKQMGRVIGAAVVKLLATA